MSNKTLYLNSSLDTKALTKTKRGLKIAGYANTTAKDRSGDVVTANAWAKGVENFRKNPIMLFQHKHDCPIGRFDKITVDKKGIYVEGTVSDAAEKNHGVQTLIEDGALKSFSVGFRIKDAEYDSISDSTTIKEVELLEISVVSVPCNQESLFSIRKNFENDDDYKSFIKSFEAKEEVLDELGDEPTELVVETIEDELDMTKENKEESSIDETIEETQETKVTDTEEISTEKQENKTEEKTEEVEVAKETDTTELVEEDLEELTDKDPNEAIPFINLLSVNLSDLSVGDHIKYSEKMYKVDEIPNDQNPKFKLLEVDAEGQSCHNTINVELEKLPLEDNSIKNTCEDEESDKSLNEGLHEKSTKENNMADQVVETVDLTEAAASAGEKVKSTATVSEPRVAELVEKTGEAILKEGDAKDLRGEYTPRESDDLAELKSQIAKHKEEIKALTESKMQYSENSRTGNQFSEKEMANAVLLAKALNKRDIYDTKYATRMKAVTSVDQFLSNFSKNVYAEMEQNLVIAPMFNRMPVDAKTFRVPVADEDTDGDVAMFRSGTYATGVADGTNVPTSNQNSISAVEFTPHKFMATTHLAKDEEEDTVLPLLDFLRMSTTRRMARAIDKSILRGTGALTGFTGQPTNAITAGTGYASVIEGITNLAADASLEVSTGSSTDKADPSDIAAARTLMGKYGLQLGNDLVFVTSIEGYNNLVTTSDFRTVDKFGPNATYLTGSVGAVYGIPIAISEFLDGVGTTGNHLGTLIYKPGFMIAERRGMEIESEYEPRQQVTALYMSTRFDFKALTTNSSAALDTSKYAMAATVVAG